MQGKNNLNGMTVNELVIIHNFFNVKCKAL